MQKQGLLIPCDPNTRPNSVGSKLFMKLRYRPLKKWFGCAANWLARYNLILKLSSGFWSEERFPPQLELRFLRCRLRLRQRVFPNSAQDRQPLALDPLRASQPLAKFLPSIAETVLLSRI